MHVGSTGEYATAVSMQEINSTFYALVVVSHVGLLIINVSDP